MAIQLENIKLMASQRLTDNDDGGGHMSGTEIVDGNVNNLFPDISRLDRVYGRVSLRKAFVHIDTNDTETYSGAHAVVAVPADDPNVSVCLFETASPTDQRTAARNRIESYVTVGPRMAAWLWGDQPQGSRSLLMYTPVGSDLPDVGSVLTIYNNRNLANEAQQYVRITGVAAEVRSFTIIVNGNPRTFKRQILTVDIGEPLRYTFVGKEISDNDASDTSLYSTVVSDSAKYYGVMLPKEAYSKGDISLPVQSIFTHLVPSAQGESPMVDLTPGEAGPVFESGTGFSLNLPAQLFASGTQIHVGRAIKPGSLTITRPYAVPTVLTDNNNGILVSGSVEYGTIDYGLGTVTFVGVTSHTATATLACVIGVTVPVLPNSTLTPVELSSRGYNWTRILEPLPLPGTLKVDYMAQGKWFRLSDKGKGELVPETSGAGTGQINYQTGSVTLTCGALPDVDSAIIWLWGNPIECLDISSSVSVDIPEITHTLATKPVQPNSLTIDWVTGLDPVDGSTLTAHITDNGSGILTGNGTGWIKYSTGEMGWVPALIPAAEEKYEIHYQAYPVREGTLAPTGSGTVTANLPDGDIEPGSVVFDMTVDIDGAPVSYRLSDNGSGGLTAPALSLGHALGKSNWPGSTSLPGISGTINYLTGAVSINLNNLAGSITFRESYEKKRVDWSTAWSTGYGTPYWVTFYHNEVTEAVAVGNKAASSLHYSYRLSAASSQVAAESIKPPPYRLDLLPSAGYSIQPNSVALRWQGGVYFDRNGKMYKDINHATGIGVEAGSIDYQTGLCDITVRGNGSPEVEILSLVARFGKQLSSSLCFRTPGAPLRPGSINFVGSLGDGSPVSLSADFEGTLSGAGGRGKVNYQQGVVSIEFGGLVTDTPALASEPWYDAADVVGGKVFKPSGGLAETLLYGCVVYSYIPLDAKLIGLDPVRLPTDGRVPIVRRGDVVVVHNATPETLSTSIDHGSSVTLARTPDSIDVFDSALVPVRVESTKYQLDGNILTFNEFFSKNSYTLPIVVNNRIEDMVLVSDADITGRVTVASGLIHDYPMANTYVSSALLFGDLQARLTGLFDQETWTDVWSDTLRGDGCLATYNEINYPPVVTNAGAVTERWALLFNSTEHFKIVGENYGVVGDGYITTDCSPLNSATGKPYFFLDYRGFGMGWAAGNVIRFNTVGASPPLWVARTTLQGPATEPEDQFTIQLRGDAE